MEDTHNECCHSSVVRSLEQRAEGERKKDIKEGIASVLSAMKPLASEDASVGDYVHVGVIGSTSFYDRTGRSERICKAVGRKLAEKKVLLFTGGMEGIAESMGRAFWTESQKRDDKQKARGRVFHLLPSIGFAAWDYGVTLPAGQTMADRRIVLAKCAQVCFIRSCVFELNRD